MFFVSSELPFRLKAITMDAGMTSVSFNLRPSTHCKHMRAREHNIQIDIVIQTRTTFAALPYTFIHETEAIHFAVVC